MSSHSEPADEPNSAIRTITPTLLRGWALPSGAESKYERGRVVVIGGARKTPGAALLAGTAALRVGAGRLTMGVAASVAGALAVAMPESGVIGMDETPTGSVRGNGVDPLREELARADVVLVGAGLDHAEETKTLLRALHAELGASTLIVLDAYALGVLSDVSAELESWRGRMVLTPNKVEAAVLLGRFGGEHEPDAEWAGRSSLDLEHDLQEIARRYGAVVACFGIIAAPGGERWQIGTGQGGLSTSGSGDVLAGAIAGLLARGASPKQAACWGTHLHAAAGDRLAARIGLTGYLARELAAELPLVLAELGQRV